MEKTLYNIANKTIKNGDTMIYITGDTHADFSRMEENFFSIQSEMTKEDYIIICGDFGGVWTFENESLREKYWLDWLNEKSFTTLFVDGNHENFSRLYQYPIENWHGGRVHKIRDSVLHLMRGEIFNIDNKKIFTFGGARSHDIQDGILDLDDEEKIYEFRKMGAHFRIKDFSWWDLELPTKEEMQNGINNLRNVNYKVDYIISHCCPTNIQALLGGGMYKRDYLTDYLQGIADKTDFKKWFFGHYHDNRQVNNQYVLLYEDIIPLELKDMSLRQTILTKNISFEIKVPKLNAETIKAINDAEKGIGLSKESTNLDEMWKDLEKED